MKPHFLSFVISVTLFFLSTEITHAQAFSLDPFENTQGWDFIKSDGVILKLNLDKGRTGNSIRFDYDFTKGTGYGGIQKLFPIDLPDNYEFSFWVKAESPANNFEIKFIDSTGNNVWWVNKRNYSFPSGWKKMSIKKRHIHFAWGPTSDQNLKRIDRIEFTIASFVGGKGTIWIDDLRFEPLPPETHSYPNPIIKVTSSLSGHEAKMLTDVSEETWWQSKSAKNQEILIDFTTRREFGGLHINWLKNVQAEAFDVFLSLDGKNWEKAWSVKSNQSIRSFIRLPEADARYVKIKLIKSLEGKAFGISEIKFLEIGNSFTLNDYFIYQAKNSPIGNFPRYFLEQAQYWTVIGVNNDVKEALINEDGMIEVDKGMFSIEPMIKTDDSLYNWSKVKSNPFLGYPGKTGSFDFIPSVAWQCDKLEFVTSVAASGEANRGSQLNIAYTFENQSDKPVEFEFYLLIRPFQVNPYYQFLNLTGGAGKLFSIKEEIPGKLIVADEKAIFSSRKFDSFYAGSLDDGNLVEMISEGKFPVQKSASDQNGLANGMMKYKIQLKAGEQTEFFVLVPFYGKNLATHDAGENQFSNSFSEAAAFWQSKLNHIRFNLPESANRIVNTYKANLAYILINRDKAGIQPGSRSYERSWIRDGALTSSALLKSGIVTEVSDFINWYEKHLYENGKVPCVVDFRGPDPVPENDSHGEFIYLIREYFNFTKDTAFLRSKNESILKTISYIEGLIAERSTDQYKNGNDSVRAYFGLVPESISHEGYSAKPMHSYWDNFFTMKGLKDAVEIQKILGEIMIYMSG